MYIMYTLYMHEYNIKDFRNNLRTILDQADDGLDVFVKRHSTRYFVCTESFYRELLKPDTSPIIKTPQDAQEAVERLPKPKQAKTRYCKHGYPLGECFDKKSDRSCKL